VADVAGRGEWIWSSADGPANTWMCFRREFGLAVPPKRLPTRVAADTKYRLWVNGRLVVREGGLKRGPTPADTYADQIDLAPHLRKGRNVIAVLVWYWGKHSFSHRDSGRGGFFLESVSDAVPATDGTWKVREHPAFRRTRSRTTRQLDAWSIWYDAREARDGWEQAECDDAGWSAAVPKGRPPCAPWGALVPRPVPFWRYGAPRMHRISPPTAQTFSVRLPYNCQFTPIVEVNAPAGVQVALTTDCARRGRLWARYVTRAGRQRWESPGWLNGETIRGRLSGPVDRVRNLRIGYRESGIDADFAGSFTCDDAALNALWRKSARTTYLCIRDNYMDCPDRERAQWWGDAVNEILQTFYCLSPAAHASVRKGIREIAAWQRPDGVLYSPVPQGSWGRELCTQMLAGTWVLWPYYEHTGDIETLRAVYPAVQRYLAVWDGRKDDKGLVVPHGEWLWFDWGAEPRDGYRMTNALYVLVLRTAAKIAQALSIEEDAQTHDSAAEQHLKRCVEHLMDGAAFGPDERANALMVLAGAIGDGDVFQRYAGGLEHLKATDRTTRLIDVLSRTRTCSPYLERYVLEALCRLGRMDLAMARMKARYGPMLRSRWTTLWEEFPTKGTSNHAWSGGPLHILSAYAAGVRPVEPGYAEYVVEPQLGPLKRVRCIAPTARGEVSVAVSRARRGLTLRLISPPGTLAHVAVPVGDFETPTLRVGQRVVWGAGRAVGRVPGIGPATLVDGRFRFTAAPGTYTIHVRG
jgi:alpha-L-rhamnosidase